jgi:hypothetical protein
MTSIVIIEKSGEIKEKTVKNLVEGELYKSVGFKSAADFKCHTVWNLEVDSESYSIELYGKTSGRAGQENRFELPPPLDTALFFGSCAVVRRDKSGGGAGAGGQIVGLKAAEWEVIYESLYGGFEDIEMSDSEDDEDEYNSDDDLPKTKTGYAKDDFVVDDEEDDEDAEEDDDTADDDDEDEIVPVKSAAAAKKRTASTVSATTNKSKTSKKSAAMAEASPTPTPLEQNYLDCTTELTEEEYDDDDNK